MTALDIISSALRLIGVLASGEVPSAAEAADALVILNDMVDQWNAEELMIFTVQRQVFTLIPGQQAYTMGTGGDFNVPRPSRIDRAGIINLNNPAQPLEIPIEYMTDAQWAAIPVKNITNSLPQYVWDTQDFPLRTLNYWVIPNVACQTALYTWTSLTSFTDLTTDLTFPPGYAKAIRYSLAIDLCPEFKDGAPPPPAVISNAIQAKAIVKSANIGPIDLQCDVALIRPNGLRYDWRSDLPVKGNRH